MVKIMASPYIIKRTGQHSKLRIVWATFCSYCEAQRYSEQLKTENPTWIIEVHQ